VGIRQRRSNGEFVADAYLFLTYSDAWVHRFQCISAACIQARTWIIVANRTERLYPAGGCCRLVGSISDLGYRRHYSRTFLATNRPGDFANYDNRTIFHGICRDSGINFWRHGLAGEMAVEGCSHGYNLDDMLLADALFHIAAKYETILTACVDIDCSPSRLAWADNRMGCLSPMVGGGF